MKLVGASLFTLGLISTFVFSIILAVLIYLDSMDIGFAMGLTVTINLIFWLIGPWISDHFGKWFYQMRFLQKDDMRRSYPELYSLIDQVSTGHHFPFPKIGIISDDNPTAYTYGSGRYNARIIVTEGLLKYLSVDEAKAVVAHELGHIVHRDVIVMMVASTLVQILYEIYAVLIRARGKKSGSAKIIACISYALYLVSTYLLFYLSRTREKLADEFASTITPAADLATSLIKISYGIVAAEDTDSSKRLLHSTRHLGIVDVQNAKHVGAVSYITHDDPRVIAEVMAYDLINPWAKLIELNSTHPLTGKRLEYLRELSEKQDKHAVYNVTAAIARIRPDMNRLRGDFITGISVYIIPAFAVLIAVFILPMPYVLGIAGVGILIQILYMYPNSGEVQTTILEQMRDIYASPVRGKIVRLEGNVIGRGVPGYIFSEDMMFQDKTGITFLNYHSAFGFFGNLFFAVTKLKSLIGVPSRAYGWFFRGMSSSVSLYKVETDNDTVHSHPALWNVIIAIVCLTIALLTSLMYV